MPHVTVTAPPAFTQYVVGATAQASFVVPFTFFSLSGLSVLTLDAGGAISVLSYASAPASAAQFSTSGTLADGGYSGGVVTIGGGGVANVTVTILRDIPQERLTDFPYPAALLSIRDLNTELDVLTARINDTMRMLSRALTVSDAAVLADGGATLPVPVAGRAPKWNATATGLVNTDHDPDDAWNQAAAASASAAGALSAAAAAAASAAAAAASAADTGAGSVSQWGPFVLVAGTQDYLLPDAPSSAETMAFVYDVAVQSYRDVNGDPLWSITDTLGDGRTLHLNLAVTSNGTGGTFEAGKTISGILIGALKGDALGPGSVGTIQIADDAVTKDKVPDGEIPPSKLSSDDFASKIAALPYGKVDTTGVAAGSMAIAAGNTIGWAAPPTTDWTRWTGQDGQGAWLPTQWDLGELALTSGTTAAWTIPQSALGGFRTIEFDLRSLMQAASPASAVVLQLGTGATPTWVTSGYVVDYRITGDTGDGSGGGIVTSANYAGMIVRNINEAYNAVWFSKTMYLRMVASNKWRFSLAAHMRMSGGSGNWAGDATGEITLSAPLTAIRLATTTGATYAAGAAFASGSAAALAR